MRNFHAVSAALLSALLLAGCQTATTRPQEPESQAKAGAEAEATTTSPLRRMSLRRFEFAPLAAEPDDSWSLTRQQMQLDSSPHERIDTQIAWFSKHSSYISSAAEQAVPYYHYVLSEVLKRQMPAELALLPMVESRYNPNAVSPSQAAGAWQFIPGTAKLFGLRQNKWYDGRRDIIESTQAALDYLQYLNQRFEGDWLLTLAAYNGGEGTVARAIKRNRAQDLPTDYWSLDLPRETQRYVPKLLAIARIIEAPQDFDLELPAIDSEPYFAVVDIDGQIELNQAAKLAGIAPEELSLLNPGFSRWATDPEGPHRLLVPVANASRLKKSLAAIPASARMNFANYTVRSGDSLSHIAAKFDTPISAIRKANKLVNNRIRAGQTLLIPSAVQAPGQIASNSRQTHRVASGENLSQIARRYGVSTEQLAGWNRLSDASTLRPGQDLILYPNTRNPGRDPG